MEEKLLFTYQPGVDLRKEKAFRMISEGRSLAEVRLALQISEKTLAAWLKTGLPAGDPDLDQLSLVDGFSDRESYRQHISPSRYCPHQLILPVI